MIIMNLELDNILGFEDFKINFFYPKKIVNTTITFEYLQEKPNFNYDIEEFLKRGFFSCFFQVNRLEL